MMTDNIVWQEYDISKEDRMKRMGQEGLVIWLTGLSGAGKTTIAKKLESYLHQQGFHTFVLDGDNIRHGLNADLGFSADDREENIRRIKELAKLFSDAGYIVITAFISPFEKNRQACRDLIGERYVEVFLDCSLEICEERDTKGLYKKARSGEIDDFTGISSPYEKPQKAEVVLNTGELSPKDSVMKIVDQLKDKKLI